MTQPTNDVVWEQLEARLRRVESLIPPPPPWTGPAERPSDGVIRVAAGPTVSRRRAPERRIPRAFTIAMAALIVAAIAVGLRGVGAPPSGPGGSVSSAPLPSALDWRWTASGPPDGLTLDIGSASVTLHVSDTTVEFGAGLSSADRMTIVQDRSGLGCAADSVADYDWRFDGMRLVLSAVNDDCTERRDAISRTWTRQWPQTTLGVRSIPGGAYRIDWLRPAVTLFKPVGLEFSSELEGPRVPLDLESYWSATEANGGVLVITRVESVPADACDDSAGVVPLNTSSPAAALDGLRGVNGLDIGTPRSTRIDGREAMTVDVTVVATCGQGHGSIWTAAPSSGYGEGGESQLSPGSSARVTFVGVDGSVVAIAVHRRLDQPVPLSLDEAEARLRALIDSITFE